MHDSDVQIQSSVLDQFDDKPSDQSSDLVSIQEMKNSSFVRIIKNDSIGISVERAVSLQRNERYTRRSSLLRLDVIGTALRVERSNRRNFIFGDVESEGRRSDMVDESLQFRCSYSVRAIDRDG